MNEMQCSHCEGRGYQGTAYWDEELDWYIFGEDGHSCSECEGTGLSLKTQEPVKEPEFEHV